MAQYFATPLRTYQVHSSSAAAEVTGIILFQRHHSSFLLSLVTCLVRVTPAPVVKNKVTCSMKNAVRGTRISGTNHLELGWEHFHF